jgi:protein O-GlcNAc transferase
MIPRSPPSDSADHLREAGLAAARAGRFAEAQSLLEAACEREPGHTPTLINLGAVLQAQLERRQALACYERALALDPGIAEGWNNRSLILSDLGRYPEAAASAQRAIDLRPQYAEALNNLGSALYGLGDKLAALARYREATVQRPNYARAWGNSGAVLLELGDPVSALQHLEKAISLDPNLEFLAGLAQHVRMKLCDWRDFDQHCDQILKAVDRGGAPSPAFAALGLFDDPQRHRLLAERWAHKRLVSPVKNEGSSVRAGKSPNARIRIGYFSGDFYHHATSHLIAGLLEAHDRQHFEIIGFSFGPTVRDSMATRVQSAFDQFIDVRALSDTEIVLKARELQLDIAVDLKGYTQDSRANIFALRAAPIQVSYLGYPGTLGLSSMDYLVADNVVTPPDSESYYSEKIIRLPDSYQVNDPKRSRKTCELSRSDHGLPEDTVVFCCFNNSYKILPAVFASWMRVLRAVPQSVLWLLNEHPIAIRNLRREAERQGVAANRLVFAARESTGTHLARHVHADVFLDTFPYNAHTTASDALWMGVPLVTRSGESFASRVAASLLHAVGLSQLVARDTATYEQLAVALGQDSSWRHSLKQSLLAVRDHAPLFDLNIFTRNLEAAYSLIVRHHQAGLPPEHLTISR